MTDENKGIRLDDFELEVYQGELHSRIVEDESEVLG